MDDFPNADKNILKQVKILIIIPAYNEQESIQQTIQEVLSVKYPLSAVVINDGSTDQTAVNVSKTNALLISLPFNLGIGGAVQTGFKFAKEYDFDLAVQVDADGQHDISFLEKLIQPVLDNEVDMSIGSRFIPPFTGYQSSFVRRIGINFFAKLISLITNYKITDPTSGFRAYNKKMINVFAQYYPHDFPEPEAIVVAGRYRARIKEVPVEMRKRMLGQSSIRYFKTLYYMIKVTIAILLARIKQKKEL
ncbi:MAG: glycosyltransferase family 2 protein [Candidatus Omnitrophica bacterium]|nr:glycosyltransferase family 2 protein [Candidatus Omnitrophota bacterium]